MDPALTMAPALMGRALAYNLSSITKLWGWLPVTPDRNRPFVCELPIYLAADVPLRERTLGKQYCSTLRRIINDGLSCENLFSRLWHEL